MSIQEKRRMIIYKTIPRLIHHLTGFEVLYIYVIYFIEIKINNFYIK